MARYAFKLPDVGEGIAESEIATWRVAVGDRIEEDQPLVDVLTEKAAVEIPSPVAGTVLECLGVPGDRIAVGSVLVVIETEAAGEGEQMPAPSPASQTTGHESGTVPAQAPLLAACRTLGVESDLQPTIPKSDRLLAASIPPPAADLQRPAASPAVRRHARELGIDLARIVGSGKGGRILHEDLQPGTLPKLSAQSSAPPATAARSMEAASGVETIKLIGLRRRIAEAMQRSKQRIPHFAYVEEVDVTELEALRAHLNQQHAEQRPKLTLLPFLIRALVRAVPGFPQVNATFDDEAGVISRYQAVHAGIATQTPGGLVVPVLRNAQTHNLWSAAAEIRRLAEAARSGKATAEELRGSTITLTSLGALGGIVSTPVINAPEVAIIGVNRIVERPVVVSGQIVVRKMMNLSSSFDHRIVDGFDAAAFIQRIKTLLEHPATLFID